SAERLLPSSSTRRSADLAVVLALAPITSAPASAQSTIRVAMGGESQSLNLPRGRSAAVELPVDARDVIVSNPAVAEAMLHSPRRDRKSTRLNSSHVKISY